MEEVVADVKEEKKEEEKILCLIGSGRAMLVQKERTDDHKP